MPPFAPLGARAPFLRNIALPVSPTPNGDNPTVQYTGEPGKPTLFSCK